MFIFFPQQKMMKNPFGYKSFNQKINFGWNRVIYKPKIQIIQNMWWKHLS